jgi:hypothetical protein
MTLWARSGGQLDPHLASEMPTAADRSDEIEQTALPDRIVVGADGAYWRDFGTSYSMCPVSEDNDPIDIIAVYVLPTDAEPVDAEVAANEIIQSVRGYIDDRIAGPLWVKDPLGAYLRVADLPAILEALVPAPAVPVDAERLLIAWRRTKDFLRDRLVTSGRRDVNVNAVLRETNSAFDDPLAPNKP